VKVPLVLNLNLVWQISIAVLAGPAFIFAICILYAAVESRCSTTLREPPLSRGARFSALALAVLLSLLALLGWRTTQVDVTSKIADWASVKQPELSIQLMEQAIHAVPYERHYRRQLIFELLGQAVVDIRRSRAAVKQYPVIERYLDSAATQARQNLWLFPRDPWAVLALANVLQIRALHLLRPFDPIGGARAAQEADQLFARAHGMFPSQPLALRNWAQLKFDEGNLPDAYRLLDLMEDLIPNEIGPYYERIVMARQAGDFATVAATLARAGRVLDKQSVNQLMGVANPQQK
jgi:tetratricopeptide (TPR) repeat protein